MGFLDHPAESFQQLRRHPGAIEVQHALALVQQTHDYRFAILNGHGGYPHIDTAALHPDVEAPVLGHPLLGDVQAGHQLQAQDQRGIDPLLLHHLLLKHAIHPLPDTNNGLVRLDVDVRAAGLNRILEQRLQKLDHRRFGAFGFGREVREVEGILAQLVLQLFRQ